MSRKLPPQFTVKIEKLAPTGEGVGRISPVFSDHLKNRPVFVFGALPGETVRVKPLKKNRQMIKAELIEVLNRVSWRLEPRDNHYFSSSPWQIIPEERQLKYKRELSKEIFLREAGILPARNPGIIASEKNWYYRNKMEYSFTYARDRCCKTSGSSGFLSEKCYGAGAPQPTAEQEELSLALHKRGRWSEFYPLSSCAIAHVRINECARAVIKAIRARNIKSGDLKNLVVRYSYTEDMCLAVLYVTNIEFKKFDIDYKNLAGWLVVYSDPKSPATIATKELFRQSADYLEEEILGIRLKYYYNSFFQVNPPAFEDLLKYVKGYIADNENLVDLYSGVGTIGYALAGSFNRVISVEEDIRSIKAANYNMGANKLDNITLLAGASEKQDLPAILTGASTLLVDPPRSGMHPGVIKAILKTPPKNFIYISCNPLTQARDFARLKERYAARHWRLFDFYPQTPHVESVLILKRRKKWFFF